MLNKGLFKKLSLAVVNITIVAMLSTGCSRVTILETTTEEKEVTLEVALWGEEDFRYLTEKNRLVEAYKKVKPQVILEIKHVAPEEYDNIMRVRNTKGELPDIFPIRQTDLSIYADVMVPLNNTKAVANNEFAMEMAINGNVLGIPQNAFNEFVYYRKSIFKELNLQIPTTWEDFIKVCQTIKEGNKYTALALGAKDNWTNYPYNEYMPLIEAGDGQYYNKMAEKYEPFQKGEPFYTAYEKLQKLYDAGVTGNEPVSCSWDQARAMFVGGKAAMMAAGQWYKVDYNQNGGSYDDLGVFLLPVRNTVNDPFYTIYMTEAFWGVPKSSKHQSEALEFIEWFFASDYYSDYVCYLGNIPTTRGAKSEDPFFRQAFEGIDAKPVKVFYNEAYNKIADITNFKVKVMGQEMISGKRELKDMMSEMNAKWKKARGNMESIF